MKDYVPASCPKCSRGVNARREYVGLDVSCKHCGTVFRVVSAADAVPNTTNGSGPVKELVPRVTADVAKPVDVEIVRFGCPKCSKRLKMPRKLLGSKVTCRRCNHFFATDPAEHAVSAPAPESESEAGGRLGAIVPTFLAPSESGWKVKAESLEHEKAQLLSDQERLAADFKVAIRDLKAARKEAARLRLSRGKAVAKVVEKAACEASDFRAEIERLQNERDRERLDHEVLIAQLRAETESARRAWAVGLASAEAEWNERCRARRVDPEAHQIVAVELQRRLDDSQTQLDAERVARTRLQADHHDATTELGRLRDEVAQANAARSALSARNLQLQRTIVDLGERRQAETRSLETERDRVSAERDAHARAADLLKQELETVRGVVVRERDAHDSRLADALQGWEAERARWAEQKKRESSTARAAEEEWSQTVSALEAGIREAGEPIDRLPVRPQAADTSIAALEAALAEKSAEVEDLREVVEDARIYKKEMNTFLSGMGIRLPN